MLLSNKKKFISIDIPKTGTKTLRHIFKTTGFVDIYGVDWLSYNEKIKNTNIAFLKRINPSINPIFYQHSTSKDIENNIKKHKLNFPSCSILDVENYKKFCFIRKPLQRYLSFLNYSKQSQKKYLEEEDISLEEYHQGKSCHAFFSKHKDPKSAFVRMIEKELPQSEFIFDENDNLVVDWIFNFHEFEKEVHKLFKILDINQTPVMLESNVSQKYFKLQDVISDEAINLCTQKEKLLNQLKLDFSLDD